MQVDKLSLDQSDGNNTGTGLNSARTTPMPSSRLRKGRFAGSGSNVSRSTTIDNKNDDHKRPIGQDVSESENNPSYQWKIKRMYIGIKELLASTSLYESAMYGMLNLGYFWLLMVFTVIFYFLVGVFGVLIYLLELALGGDQGCVVMGNGTLGDFTNAGQIFSGLFALSWTTLSTVGYGNAYPALSNPDGGGADYCPGINTLLMVEAFTGVLFAGSCGAIMFTKMYQVKYYARVEFSQPAVVRFGSGLMLNNDDGESDSDDNDDDTPATPPRVVCPLLEFRILNSLHHLENASMADAAVSCSAGVFETGDRRETFVHMWGKSSRSMKRKKTVPKKTYHRMEIMNDTHPLLMRSWCISHFLDEKSPLITEKLRKRIINNGGFWPPLKHNQDTAEFISEHLCFEEILVNFTCISEHTCSEVTAQKVYTKNSVVIGYQFVPIIEKDGDEVKVIASRMHDFTEQEGPDKPLPRIGCDEE